MREPPKSPRTREQERKWVDRKPQRPASASSAAAAAATGGRAKSPAAASKAAGGANKPQWDDGTGASSFNRGLFDDAISNRTLRQEELAFKRERQRLQQAKREEAAIRHKEQERARLAASARELRAIEEQLVRTRSFLNRDATGREDEAYFIACFRRLARLEGELRVLQQPNSLKHHGVSAHAHACMHALRWHCVACKYSHTPSLP